MVSRRHLGRKLCALVLVGWGSSHGLGSYGKRVRSLELNQGRGHLRLRAVEECVVCRQELFFAAHTIWFVS